MAANRTLRVRRPKHVRASRVLFKLSRVAVHDARKLRRARRRVMRTGSRLRSGRRRATDPVLRGHIRSIIA